jgi:hypothetical protein
MCQKEIQVETTSSVEDGDGLFEIPTFVSIRSSLLSLSESKQEFGGSSRLSHQLLALSNTP